MSSFESNAVQFTSSSLLLNHTETTVPTFTHKDILSLLEKSFSFLPAVDQRNILLVNPKVLLEMAEGISQTASKVDAQYKALAENLSLKEDKPAFRAFRDFLQTRFLQAFKEGDFELAKNLVANIPRISVNIMLYIFQNIEDQSIGHFLDCMKILKQRSGPMAFKTYKPEEIGEKLGLDFTEYLTKFGLTPLMQSISNQDLKVFFFLIEELHINPHEENSKWGGNALSIAVQPRYFKFLAYLTEVCCLNVNLQAKDGSTPLFTAVGGGYYRTIEYLLDHQANPNIETRLGDTPLKAAIRAKYPQIIKLLIARGAGVHSQDSLRKITPLMQAVEVGDLPTVKLLVSLGCNLNVEDSFKNNCISRAILKRNLPMLQYLVNIGSNITDANREFALKWRVVIPTVEPPRVSEG